jgi:cold shock CspA family protein
MNGTIRRWLADRGFGFIAADDGGDYFIHGNQWQDRPLTPVEGERVAFEPFRRDDGKLQAQGVTRLLD